MQKWEHIAIRTATDQVTSDNLQGYGDDGWELVSTVPEVAGEIRDRSLGVGDPVRHEGNIYTERVTLIFKRPKD